MYSLLLALIYLAFISLGLPDALLGSAWPTIYPAMNLPISYAGIVSMIISVGTIIASLNSSRLINKFSTGLVTVVSISMTAVALFGFSFSSQFWMLCVWAIPYGLGAGAVDAALNNFIALHYKSRHMSWLHCFWGLGASMGPYIMSYSIVVKSRWETGYTIVGIVQGLLSIILIFSLPLWRKKENDISNSNSGKVKSLTILESLKIKGVKQILVAFFAYCALEATAGLWASSYLVLHRGIQADIAAKWASVFYVGITIGRFISGFITEKLGNRNMIRIGLLLIAIGILIAIMPIDATYVTLLGLLLIGFGCAPIYPSIIHETPRNFGTENSQAIIGIQMASAYTGITLMPPLFGFLIKRVSIGIYPLYLSIFLVIMFLMTEKLNKIVGNKKTII